jgi:hypothetical protein
LPADQITRILGVNFSSPVKPLQKKKKKRHACEPVEEVGQAAEQIHRVGPARGQRGPCQRPLPHPLPRGRLVPVAVGPMRAVGLGLHKAVAGKPPHQYRWLYCVSRASNQPGGSGSRRLLSVIGTGAGAAAHSKQQLALFLCFNCHFLYNAGAGLHTFGRLRLILG